MHTRKLIIWLTSIIGILLLSFTAYAGTTYYITKSQIAFDSHIWKRVPLKLSDNTRYRMHDDLLAKYKLIGMTRKQVIDLLGPQADTNLFSDWDLIYRMGPEPSLFSIDSIWLVMKVKDNKVLKYSILTD